MFFFGLVLLIIVLGSIWIGLVALAFGLGYWDKAPIRYVGLALFVLSFIPAFLLWTSDPNDSARARAWHGRYAIHVCTAGGPMDTSWTGPVLRLSDDQVCTVQLAANDTPVVRGSWNYLTSEDGDWIDLDFEGYGPVQIIGSPDRFRTNRSLPIEGCR